jgi:hypothetical protein
MLGGGRLALGLLVEGVGLVEKERKIRLLAAPDHRLMVVVLDRHPAPLPRTVDSSAARRKSRGCIYNRRSASDPPKSRHSAPAWMRATTGKCTILQMPTY